MSKKNNKNSETLSKNEKIFLSLFREESQVQKNEIIETTDFNLSLFIDNLEDALNTLINSNITTLNTFLNKLEVNKNKSFENFKDDLSSIVNHLFLLVNIEDYIDQELNHLKKEMLTDATEVLENDRVNLKYSNFNIRLKNILDKEIIKSDRIFTKIIIDTFELYKTEIINMEVKNKKIIVDEFLNAYLTRLNASSNFIDQNMQETKISFNRSKDSEKKLFFYFSQNNFTGNIDKKSLEKLSKDFNELITKNINGNTKAIEYLDIKGNDGFKISKKINPDGSIKYTGFENSFKNYSYKELNKMALEKGFKLDRQKGDHAIFIKKLGTEEKIIIIPQGRVIGKGLQATIIKNLNQN